MLDSTRALINYYWSWRRYLKANLSTHKRFYNPIGQPKPDSSTDSWIIFLIGDLNPKLFTRGKSQIFCVARDDERSQNMIQILSDVISILDNTQTGKRNFPLYDKTIGNGVGIVWIENLIQRTQLPYSPGVSSTLIDIYTRTKTARNAYA